MDAAGFLNRWSQGKRLKSMAMKGLSQMMTGLSLGIIGLLIIPTGILVALISIFWSVADKVSALGRTPRG